VFIMGRNLCHGLPSCLSYLRENLGFEHGVSFPRPALPSQRRERLDVDALLGAVPPQLWLLANRIHLNLQTDMCAAGLEGLNTAVV